jgi:hypothetical protein
MAGSTLSLLIFHKQILCHRGISLDINEICLASGPQQRGELDRHVEKLAAYAMRWQRSVF